VVIIRDQESAPLVLPLSLDGVETLSFDVGGHSGWAAYHSPASEEAGLWVWLKFAPEFTPGGSDPTAPVEIREIKVVAAHPESPEPFNSPLLRLIPFDRMVAAVNHPDNIERVRPLLSVPNEVEREEPGSSSWRWRLPPDEPVRMQRPQLRIKVPSGRRRPDEFYELVTRTYLAQATISNRPALDIAEANGLPKSTVHRWLKEARARGLLRLPRTGEKTEKRRHR
jgi:hypothetical protein